MEISIVKLKNIVSSLLDWVKADLEFWDRNQSPQASWLHANFSDVILGDMNFYEQLKDILLKNQDDVRKIEVRLMFDKERASLPTFHIHYPTEDLKSGDNTLNTGYSIENSSGVYSRSAVGHYELIVTAGNSLECVMLYEFMDALLIAAADTLAYNFDKYEFSGKQLMTNPDIIPFLTYYRSIIITLQSKKVVSKIAQTQPVQSLTFNTNF